MQYGKWLELWLQTFVKPTVKITTYQRYAAIVNAQIIPILGEYKMKQIALMLLQSKVADFSKQYSPNTVKLIIHIIKKSLNCAAETGVMKRLDLSELATPEPQEKEVICFTPQEQEIIETYVLGSQKPKLFGILLDMYTGLRIGELMALKWSDIDLANRYLTVNKTCTDKWIDGKYYKVIQTAKTKSSNRIIPIPQQLIPYLKDIKKQSKSEYVVSDKYCNGISVRSYRRTFELLLKKLNIPHKGFHSLRHTFATRAIECGIDIKTLAELLGHSDPTMTLKRYAHSLIEHKIYSMKKLGKYFQIQRQKYEVKLAAKLKDTTTKKRVITRPICSWNSLFHEQNLKRLV